MFCFKCCEKLNNFKIGICPVCKNKIDITKFVNLSDKKSFNKVRFLFEDPEIQIEKFRQAFKFQETSQNKYILFLQYKMQTLMKENTSLRESVNKIYRNNK